MSKFPWLYIYNFESSSGVIFFFFQNCFVLYLKDAILDIFSAKIQSTSGVKPVTFSVGM